MNVQVFKKINLGGLSKKELLEKLEKANIQFNKYAHVLFDNLLFDPPSGLECVTLVKLNPHGLNLSSPSTFEQIVEQAKKANLKLCPLWLGAYLRLEYLEQEVGPYLTIASQKLSNDKNYPNGFYVRNIDSALWLRGYRASDDYKWSIDSDFVFIQ